MAHALYRSAKLDWSCETNLMMPRIRPAFPDVPVDEKQVVFIDSGGACRLRGGRCRDCPANRPPRFAQHRTHFAGRSGAHRRPLYTAAAPRERGTEASESLARTFIGLPCFRLHLARDSRKNVLAIERTMRALRSRGAHG